MCALSKFRRLLDLQRKRREVAKTPLMSTALTSVDLASPRQRADSGDSGAQCELAVRLHNGTHNITRDYSEALIWFRRAADQAHAYAMDWLGQMYADGEGVTRDIAQAHAWYGKAAEQYRQWADMGDVTSQYRLGLYYKESLGVPQDFLRACDYFDKAADQGHADAQNYLGIMYHDGLGIRQDFSAALRWFRKAAAEGHTSAQTWLGYMYEKGEGVSQDCEMARELFSKAAAGGNEVAKARLAPLILLKRLEEMNKSLEQTDRNLKELANNLHDQLGNVGAYQSDANTQSRSSRQENYRQVARTPEEIAAVDAFRKFANDRATLACRLYCQEKGLGDSHEVKPETVLLVDVLKVIYSVVHAISDPISDHHGRLLLLLGQVIYPTGFNTYSVQACSDLIVELLDEEPPEGLWEPVICRVLARYDEQHGSNYADLPRQGFQLLVLAAAALSTSAKERRQVIRRYKLLLGGNANEAEHSADESALQAYEIFGVPPTCTDKELNTAYHKRTDYWHPDKFHSVDIPKEMKEMATREMARVNAAYKLLEKLRATPSAFKLNDTRRKPAADAPKRDDLRACGNTENVPPQKSHPSSSHNPEVWNDGESFMNDSEHEYDITGRPVRSEQEKFYRTVNRVAEEHSTEISLGLAYGKYRFWKAVFKSKPGQFIVLVILAGICWIFGDYSSKIILALVITIIVWIVLTIVVGVIGGAIAGWKNPGGEHERTKVGFVPTLFIWVVVFLFLTFMLNKSPEETAPSTQPVTQESKPEKAPIPPTSTLPEPTASDPATAGPIDESQTVAQPLASDTGQSGSQPQGEVSAPTSPANKLETGFQACVQYKDQAYSDCMKPYR